MTSQFLQPASHGVNVIDLFHQMDKFVAQATPIISAGIDFLDRKVAGPVKVFHIGILLIYFAFRISSQRNPTDTATASHILVKSKDLAIMLKNQIDAKDGIFGDLAKEHSECPSGKTGGSLGQFSRGDMVDWINLSFQNLIKRYLILELS